MLFISISSCKNDDDVMPNLVANKEFVFALVSSQEECDFLISQGVNCSQSINFLDHLNARIIVTDIANAGTYTLNENTITITIDSPGDAENPMIFEANSDFSELIRVSDGSNDIWKLQIEGVSPWDL